MQSGQTPHGQPSDSIGGRLWDCFGCVWDRDDAFLVPGDAMFVELEAGRHFVRMAGDSAETPSLTVRLVPAPGV